MLTGTSMPFAARVRARIARPNWPKGRAQGRAHAHHPPLFWSLTLITSPALAAGWGQLRECPLRRVGGRAAGVFRPAATPTMAMARCSPTPTARSSLRVYGGNIIERDFEADANTATQGGDERRLGVSYERVTPSWASYSGTRQGSCSMCGRSRYVRGRNMRRSSTSIRRRPSATRIRWWTSWCGR